MTKIEVLPSNNADNKYDYIIRLQKEKIEALENEIVLLKKQCTKHPYNGTSLGTFHKLKK